MGNVRNYMNSVAIIEHPAGEHRLFYISTLISNVLRKNSAVEHQTMATRIQRLIEKANPVMEKVDPVIENLDSAPKQQTFMPEPAFFQYLGLSNC